MASWQFLGKLADSMTSWQFPWKADSIYGKLAVQMES
jgi:hypothetical protein